ncbi:hypothetical protein GEMRC1_011192 [Eukaryota sp. GEM-RC1]
MCHNASDLERKPNVAETGLIEATVDDVLCHEVSSHQLILSETAAVGDESDKALAKTSHHSPLFQSPCKYIGFQQSLLISIHLHVLRRFAKSSLEHCLFSTSRALITLKQELPAFFEKIGYVSHNFFESVFLAIKVFFETSTFPTVYKDVPQLCSFASFFKADLRSVFLYVYDDFKAEEFLDISNIVSGLELTLDHHNDLEFLNKSSSYYPYLKQLNVRVFSSLSIALIELLKCNTTVTGVDLRWNSIGDEGVKALADALKVNTTISNINLFWNSIEDAGARALADALTVNTTVTSIDLGSNSIGNEGAKALAKSLYLNSTVSSINLESNFVKSEGARALAEALKVNGVVSCINLIGNPIGNNDDRALIKAISDKIKL